MLFALLTLFLLFSHGLAGAQTSVDIARDKGLAWLITQQKPDGNFRTASGAEFTTTAAAVGAFANAGLRAYPYTKAISWLTYASAASVDSLARQIVALAGARVDVAFLLNRLQQRKNKSFAWGAYDSFDTSFPDTPLALGAIRQTGYINYTNDELATALCSMLLAQKSGDSRTNGSWSYTSSGISPPASALGGATLPTTANILEIYAIKLTKNWPSVSCSGTPLQLQPAVDSGINWLLTQKRKPDGGFSDETGNNSSVLATALAYEVLSTVAPSDPAIAAAAEAAKAPALNYLLNSQHGDGSWNGDALETAFVLKVLPSPTTPYTDTDKDGLPDSINKFLAEADPVTFEILSLSTGGSLILVGGMESGRPDRGPAFQLLSSAGNVQVGHFVLNSDFTELQLVTGNLDDDPADEVLVGGTETGGLARGPAFEIYKSDGSYKAGAFVLSQDFTDLKFSIANVIAGANGSTPGVLVCGRETSGAERGPAFQIFGPDGTYKANQWVLFNEYMADFQCFAGRFDNTSIENQIVVGGRETQESARGPVVQIWDKDGNLKASNFVLTPDSAQVSFTKIHIDGADKILVGGRSVGGLAFQIWDKDPNSNNGRQLLSKSMLSAAFTGATFGAIDVNGDGEDEILVGATSAGGPEFQVWDKTGNLLFSQSVLNSDFTEVSFTKIHINGVDKVLVGGRETEGLQRGPAFQVWDKDPNGAYGRLLVSLFVLDPDFSNLRLFAMDQNGDGNQEVGVGGEETTGLRRGPAYQIWQPSQNVTGPDVSVWVLDQDF